MTGQTEFCSKLEGLVTEFLSIAAHRSVHGEWHLGSLCALVDNATRVLPGVYEESANEHLLNALEPVHCECCGRVDGLKLLGTLRGAPFYRCGGCGRISPV